jgi:phosphate-selective porin OprO/OprP
MSPYAAPAAELDDLQRQVDALQSELSRVKAQQSQMQSAQQAAAEMKDDGKSFKIKYKPGVQIESADKNFKAHVGGRIMVDSVWYDEDKSDLGDGTEIRRGRLFLSGTMYKVWDYKFQYDFTSSGSGGIRDAYFRYKGLKPATLSVGNLKVPFSLEELTSSKYITFMERALPNVFAPGRRLGALLNAHGDYWTFAAGIYGDEVDGDVDDEGDEPWEIGGRVTVAPLHEKTRALHLGVGAVYADPNDAGSVRFRQRPESHVTSARFVNTGSLDTDDFWRIGPEVALVYGPFAVQGEYMHVGVNRSSGSDVDFDGWYVEGSYFLTGESRAYSPKKGSFGRVKPKRNLGDGGYGAWQVGVRYSTVDLTDEDVLGGEEDNVTIGLNWHVNPYIRFMFNAIWVNNDEDATGNASHLHTGELSAGDDDPFIAQVRAQIDF